MLDVQLLAPQTTRALRREEYDRLVAMGAFEDERVELIEGVLVTMSTNDPQHASPVQVLNELLLPVLLGRAVVRIQLPLVAAHESEPEPDVAIVPLGDYRRAHPEQAHCVIEVANSSVSKDRNIKAPLYAVSGFLEYWLVNIPEQVVEVFRAPGPDGYAQRARYTVGETIALEAFPDVRIQVARVLNRPRLGANTIKDNRMGSCWWPALWAIPGNTSSWSLLNMRGGTNNVAITYTILHQSGMDRIWHSSGFN